MPGSVVVVDRDDEMRDLFHAVLTRAGHSVRTYSRLEELSAAPEAPPDVLMVDATCAPNGDLSSLVNQISAQYSSSEVVYLVNTSESALKRQLERGRIRHFVRPFQIEDLRELVNTLLERRSPARR
ncbi:MAG TPA: hypothetical protein P5179_10855 [Candidatus Latescibacteria bacterium]|nr:hypothetical protein [Candidatus Latescibacterota bacterium]HRS95759.1 hypothetical protein [Candidatus Latescibacterota bacterium]HRU23698.1 hypothetical protein [Candidatus Latescibacterota bacterium]